MARIVVRLASSQEDMLAIEALRDLYYDRRGEAVQRRQGVTWTVCAIDGIIRACRSTLEGAPGERWQMDLYSDGTRLGTAALGAIMRAGHEQADADGVRLFGVTAADNVSMLELAQKHGWSVAGMLIYRPVGGRPCPE